MNELLISTEKIKGLTKTEISNLASELIQPIEEGLQSAFQADLYFKGLEEALKEARERINAAVRAEAEEMISGGQKEFNKVSFEVRKGYATYDLEQDSEYSKIKTQLENRGALLKQVAKSQNLIMMDEETGEQIIKVPVKSYSKDSIVYKFSK